MLELGSQSAITLYRTVQSMYILQANASGNRREEEEEEEDKPCRCGSEALSLEEGRPSEMVAPSATHLRTGSRRHGRAVAHGVGRR